MAKLYVYRILKWRVVDGDTIHTTLDTGFNNRKDIYIRLNGIDTPEDRGDEKRAGIPVAHVVAEWLRRYSDKVSAQPISFDQGTSLDDGELYVHSLERGKYRDRVVGTVWGETDGHPDDVDLATYLLSHKLCHQYDGGTKTPFTEAELDRIEADAKKILAEGV